MYDLRLEHLGAIVTLEAHTETGKRWIVTRDDLVRWLWLGRDRVAIQAPRAASVLEAALADGIKITTHPREA